jgi:hypothetical protein
LFALLAGASSAQEKIPIFVSGLDEAAPVVRSLTNLMNGSKPFQVVGQKDPSSVVVLVS